MKELEGNRCPEFSGPSTNNCVLSNHELLGQNYILLFYPKDFTPGCTKEVCDVRDIYQEILAHGYRVIGISRDNAAQHRKFVEQYNLPFELIADVDGKITEAFGVWQQKSMFGKKYMGIVRSTVAIDADGIVVKVWPKVSVTKHQKEIMTWLEATSSADLQ